MTKHTITTAITTVALAAICACNKDNRDTVPATPPMDQPPVTRSAPPAEPQDATMPITVTGCLQKAGALMTTYIVTGVNEPSDKGIGTTGSPAAVEREQLSVRRRTPIAWTPRKMLIWMRWSASRFA